MESSVISCRRALQAATAGKSSKRRRSRRMKRVALAATTPPRSSVQMKVRKLQRLIPGGTGLQPDLLFSRTADYILQLRLQVTVLQALFKIYRPWTYATYLLSFLPNDIIIYIYIYIMQSSLFMCLYQIFVTFKMGSIYIYIYIYIMWSIASSRY